MDFLQDYFPELFHIYTQYYSPYEAYLGPLRRYLYFSQSFFYQYAFPYLWPAYKLGNKALRMLSADTPNMATLALLAVVLIISLKILDILRKSIIQWISMAIRLGMWILVSAIGVYVWQRGFEQSFEDLAWVAGLVAGLENEGERIGNTEASRRRRDARRIPTQGHRGRTRGAGWN